MDKSILVDGKIEDGHKVIAALSREGYPVSVALWAKSTPESPWYLYIASPMIERGKIGKAFVAVFQSLQSMAGSLVTHYDIKLLYDDESLAKAAIELRDQQSRKRWPIRFFGPSLGNTHIEEAFIYPPDRPMEVVVKGKDNVLRYLESEAMIRSGQSGEYLLARDEKGDMIAFIAGHGFVGAGSVRIGDKSLVIVDGIMTAVTD